MPSGFLKLTELISSRSRSRSKGSGDSQTSLRGQEDSADPAIKGTIDYCLNYTTGQRKSIIQSCITRPDLMTLDSAMVTPKPSADDQTRLVESLKEWLPVQSIDKPDFLRQWHMEKRDTIQEVTNAASDRLSSIEKGTAWVVPFEHNEPSASQPSSGPTRLFDNSELTGSHSHWGDENPNNDASDRMKMDGVKGDPTHDEDPGYSTPVPKNSDPSISDEWASDTTPRSPERTDSAPFYQPSGDGNEDPTGCGESSADVWSQ